MLPCRPLALSFCLVPLLTACEPQERCIETVELIDFKADTTFGLSASEALAQLQSPYSGPMGYTNEYPAVPELRGVMAQAELAILYAEGEVRFHDLEENPDYREPRFGGSADIAYYGEICPDRIEVDLVASFHTDDGRFAEDSLEGVMTISKDAYEDEPGPRIGFRAELPLDELQGSFTRELVQDDLSGLFLTWAPSIDPESGEASVGGGLESEVHSQDGDWVGYGFFAWIGQNPLDGDN